MEARSRGTLIAFVAGVSVAQLLSHPARAEGPTQKMARQACEEALDAEEKAPGAPSSRAACYASRDLGTVPEDFRNKVASLMSPRAQPSLDDLVLSALNADAAVHKLGGDTWWGYLARCDIARRLGNADLMEACLADLKRVAPAEAATKRALAYTAESASVPVWILRVLLSLGLLGTLLHALLERRKKVRPALSGSRHLSGVALGMIALVAVHAGVARAEETPPKGDLSDFKINDADPLGSLPKDDVLYKNPLQLGYLVQDLLDKADHAAKAGDHAAEARYYRALTKVAPGESYAPRKLCEAYEATGDIPNAILACRTLLARPGTTVNDSLHFIDLVLSTKGPLPAGEREELDTVIKHLTSEVQLGAVATMLRCEVALRFRDYTTLETCTNELATKAPKDPKTISLQWAVAIEKHDRGEALALIDRARGAGMSDDGLARMERATRAMTLRRLGMLAFLLVVMAGAAFALLRFRREVSRRRLAV
jgi:hypothetical protein